MANSLMSPKRKTKQPKRPKRPKPKPPKILIPREYENQLFMPIQALCLEFWRAIKPIYVEKIRVAMGPVQKRAPKVTGTFFEVRENKHVKRFIAKFTAQIDQSARTATMRYGLEPADEWSITNQSVYDQITDGLIDLCQSTIDELTVATGKAYEQILAELRQEILDNQRSGETILSLTQKLEKFFSTDAAWRARRIAHTESARSNNIGYIEGVADYEEVLGFEWCLSSDACELCHAVGLDQDGQPRQIAKGTNFAVNMSGNANYSQIRCPPLHPNCRCAVNPVLDFEETRFATPARIEAGKITVSSVTPRPTKPLIDLTTQGSLRLEVDE